jgi:hypothetical protein
MTAHQLIEALRRRGVELHTVDGKLRFRLHKDATVSEQSLRETLSKHKAILLEHLAFVRSASAGSDVITRAERFAACRTAWQQAGRIGEPLFTLTYFMASLPAAHCLSCGAAIGKDEKWRCQLCVEAINRVLALNTPPGGPPDRMTS